MESAVAARMGRPQVYEKAITLPFQFDSTGKVAVSTSQSKIWADRVRSAIGTSVTERVYRPKFGTQIPSTIFNNSDEIEGVIEEEISKAFVEFLPTLTLEELTASYDITTSAITVEVKYLLPDRTQSSVIVGVATISTDQVIREDLV